MVSVSEARRIIHTVPLNAKIETVALEDSNHRLLAEDIVADQDIPSFDRVSMDGIAIDFKGAETKGFIYQSLQRAGEPPHRLLSPEHAIEIMTGAVCPDGANMVVPYENCDRISDLWEVKEWPAKPGANIHRAGSDHRKGDVLLSAGTMLGPAACGVLASVGKSQIKVHGRPSIKIFSTGDELVPVGSTPLPHQVRRSNVVSLKLLLNDFGFASDDAHLPDDRTLIEIQLGDALNRNDVVLLSGGVSRGKFDLLPEILESLGVQKHFHRVRQKPGKPFWFGSTSSSVVFAFPGNPVSTFVCALVYLVPWLRNGKHPANVYHGMAPLEKEYVKPIGMTHFVPATFADSGALRLLPGHGSGDFTNLAQASVLVELKEEASICSAGELYPFILFRG